jgi:hypothetical protein
MPGKAPPDASAANHWLMGSALTSFVLGRRAGLKADFPREYSEWDKHAMVFLPSPITSTSDPFLVHVHSDFYAKARKYVENGGFLYASLAADGAIPEMDSLFGARMVDRAVSTEVTLKFVEPFGDFKPGDTLHYTVPSASIESWGTLLEVSSGKVIAVDQDGHPALVTNQIGSGKTLLSAYPLEHYLAEMPAVFEKPEETYRLYAAFRDWVGVKPQFRVDNPSVELSVLGEATRGYAVAVNHSFETQKVTVRSGTSLHSVSLVAPDGLKSLPIDASSWQLEIAPFDAAIVEWKR